ncbi:hypothetical protein LH53_01655 [Mesotoga sp. TolDC]|uniref:Peptidase MA-like domain-containing protein n=2 Tax=Mesotoga infera TaxID=1236046 RepID=A0A117LUE1_9BACT|nr:hypothetical protein [Mesotoga sp. UBA6090]KUK68002.1 MAG: Uncharacterized protein XD86_0465 [Mesotoga infera]KUK89429.1 MAG: Uncharacterized protein XE02_1031 [Mesotoga infera]PZC52977.1 hypothetical protein LH53_01655 [Mesotoga sp. TolDC]
MKSILVILVIALATVSGFGQLEIRNEIEEANAELSMIYSFSVKYSLTILKGEGHEQPAAIDNNGIYQIFLYTSSYKPGVARHELAHVYFFEYLRSRDLNPDEIPLWYHEVIAEGFQNLHTRTYRPELRAAFFDFTEFDRRYPQKADQSVFYGAVSSFAGYILARYSYRDLIRVIDEFSDERDIDPAFIKVFGSSLSSMITSWRLTILLPYSPFLIGVVLFLYLLIGRRDKYWRKFPLDLRSLGEDEETKNRRV